MQSREINSPPTPPPEYRPPMGRGCVTNIPKPRPTRKPAKPAEPAKKMKPSDSTSSFEDLADEAQEFKEDIPRTM